MTTVRFDMVQTVAVAVVVLFLGYGVRRQIGVLDRFAIPPPVVGGIIFAGMALVLRQAGVVALQLDTTLQSPVMIACFTAIGLGAGFGLLKTGGAQVMVFGVLAGLLAVIQNGVGIGLAALFGMDPLIGLITGSITMTGGHGIGAAFGTLMEDQFQLRGAVTIAMAAATFGLVAGTLVGSPLSTWLIQRRGLVAPASREAAAARLEGPLPVRAGSVEPAGEPAGAYGMLKTLTLVLVVMLAGGILSRWATGYGVTLPGYIASMLAAVLVRNAVDITGAVRINQRAVDDLGTIALSLFVVMAMMSLQPWDLPGLELPLVGMLAAQVVVTGLFACLVTFRMLGRDYAAAVMAGGHCGLGLGAMPVATASMAAIVERLGPAPRAFLVVPVVGVYFNDVTNGIIIITYLNLVR